jgi:hypothetical protein
MTIPIPPWWLRFLDGGNAKSAAVAGIAFTLGYLIGKGDRSHWKDVARSADSHWRKEHGWHDDHHEGKHTEREHDRNQYRRGEYGR